MSVREITRLLAGVGIPNKLTDGKFSIGVKPAYFELYMPSNDVFDMKTSVNANGQSFMYTLEFYKIVDDKPNNPRKIAGWNITNNHSFTLENARYIVKIYANNPIELTIELGKRNYIQFKEFQPRASVGSACTVRDFVVNRKRKKVRCNEPLRYELVEGMLPPDLRLYEYDGLITGVIANMDCQDGDSPSFNWFYTNHDGINQSWARIWRFKLRVSLVRDPNINHEEWFCIKVHNNWTYDRIKYQEEIEANQTQIEIIGDTVKLTPQAIAELQAQQPQQEHTCIPCNDPNANYEDDIINLPPEYDFRFPFEVVEWYKKHQLGTSRFIMELNNRKIFNEAINYISDGNDRVKYEYFMIGSQLTVRKYTLQDRSFNDFDATLLASRNIANNIRDYNLESYSGQTLTVDLWFF